MIFFLVAFSTLYGMYHTTTKNIDPNFRKVVTHLLRVGYHTNALSTHLENFSDLAFTTERKDKKKFLLDQLQLTHNELSKLLRRFSEKHESEPNEYMAEGRPSPSPSHSDADQPPPLSPPHQDSEVKMVSTPLDDGDILDPDNRTSSPVFANPSIQSNFSTASPTSPYHPSAQYPPSNPGIVSREFLRRYYYTD